ncbi:MAG: hypothetical protein AAFY25_00275, partial [Pseudomonadota bacterium]
MAGRRERADCAVGGQPATSCFDITISQQGDIWAVRPGGTSDASIEVLAITPDSGQILFEYLFPDTTSLNAQDLRVSADGRTVYRVPTAILRDPNASHEAIEAVVEGFGVGPASNGIAVNRAGNLILTYVKQGGHARLTSVGALSTLVRVNGVDWADSVSVVPNGDIWFADSRLAH